MCGEALSDSTPTQKSNSFDENYPHLVILGRGESKTQFVSNVFDGGIRGSVTRSRSVAQEAVSTTRELSSLEK